MLGKTLGNLLIRRYFTHKCACERQQDAGVALDHGALDLDRAMHRVDHSAELDDEPVAGALDHAAMVDGDRRVDQTSALRAIYTRKSTEQNLDLVH